MQDGNSTVNTGNTSDDIVRQRILVDLAQKTRDSVNITAALEVYANPKRSLKNLFGLRKEVHRKVMLSLAELTVDPELIVSDEMLSVLIDEAPELLKPDESISMMLNAPTMRFQLIFHPSCILDATRVQGKGSNTFNISFKLQLSDENGEQISEQKIILTIELVALNCAPKVKLKLAAKEPLVFSHTLGIIKVGKIIVTDDKDLQRIPGVGVKALFTATRQGRQLDPDAFWLETESQAEIGLHLNPDGKPGFSMDRLDTIAPSHHGVNAFGVDIMCDINRIGNPYDDPNGEANIQLGLNMTYHTLTNPNRIEPLMVKSATFVVKKNVSQPELKGVIKEINNQEHEIPFDGHEEANIRLSTHRFLPSRNLKARTSITFRNPAEEGPADSGVRIRNVTLSPTILPPNGVFEKANPHASLSTLVSLDGEREIFLPNGQANKAELGIVFDGTQARELYCKRGNGRNYNVLLRVRLTFDYLVDEDGIASIDDSVWSSPRAHKYALNIEIPVYQLPDPDWLSIDFGTSAIVALHGNKVLNLNKIKQTLQNVAAGEDEYETGTKFLSSNVIFRNVAKDNASGTGGVGANKEPVSQLLGYEGPVARFDNLAVCLSPTSRTEQINIRNLLPCLKMMVGYDLLPDIDNYSAFKYWCKPYEGESLQYVGLVLEDAEEETARLYSPLARVDEVFRQVYQQLFSYYVKEAVNEKASKINQLVLTVPNTYSPYHLQRIRNIIHSNLSSINVREIKFVSESDAVACYYQIRWKEINDRLSGERNLDFLMDDETVLVFDMGAGTLDLTLFTREKDPKTGALKVKVIGKLGIAKAGNYLDALLAELLAKKIPSLVNFTDPDKIVDGDTLKVAIALKTLIKNEIKPKLSVGGTLHLKRNLSIGIKEDVKLNLDEVFLNTPEFKGFISECTTNLLKNFFEFFSEGKSMIIDTVLMSGRSAKLKSIKTALDEAITEYASPNAKVIEVKDLGSATEGEDKSKTIVAEGAAYYVDLVSQQGNVFFVTDNLSANYGVLYTGEGGSLIYKELLDPRRATPISCNTVEGIVVKTFDSGDIYVDLSHCITIDQPLTLIQTYHRDPVKAVKDGLTEYITEVISIDPRTLEDRKNTRIRLEVNSDNLMKFYINGQQTDSLSATKMDVTSKTSRRSFWPVIKRK